MHIQSSYFENPYHDSYKTQLDFYAYLLIQMGFKVSSHSYLYICNALNVDEGFNGKMIFDEILIQHQIDVSYIEEKLDKMISVLNSEELPAYNESCENCAYSRKRTEFSL